MIHSLEQANCFIFKRVNAKKSPQDAIAKTWLLYVALLHSARLPLTSTQNQSWTISKDVPQYHNSGRKGGRKWDMWPQRHFARYQKTRWSQSLWIFIKVWSNMFWWVESLSLECYYHHPRLRQREKNGTRTVSRASKSTVPQRIQRQVMFVSSCSHSKTHTPTTPKYPFVQGLLRIQLFSFIFPKVVRDSHTPLVTNGIKTTSMSIIFNAWILGGKWRLPSFQPTNLQLAGFSPNRILICSLTIAREWEFWQV